MAQQMVNGSHYAGNLTVTNRMSKDYAVVNMPFKGKHLRPQDPDSLRKRKLRWHMRALGKSIDEINRVLKGDV